jgi:hypothetical protein
MKTLKRNVLVTLAIPANLLPDQQACQINALKTALDNITKKDMDIENLKKIFDYDDVGSLHEQYHFQKLNNYLNDEKIPFRTVKDHFNDISQLFPLLSENVPVPVFFGMEVLKLVGQKLPGYKMSVGNGVYNDNNKHVMLLVGYKDAGDKLLFADPVYQLPLMKGSKLKESDMIELSFKEAFQHYKHYKSYVRIKLDKYRVREFKQSSANNAPKERQEKLG